MKFGSVIGCGVFADKFNIPAFGVLSKENGEKVDVVIEVSVPKQTRINEDGVETFRNNGFLQMPVIKYEEETIDLLRNKLHEHIDFLCDNMKRISELNG